MTKIIKKQYTAPECETVEIKMQGVLADSVNPTASIDDFNTNAGYYGGQDW